VPLLVAATALFVAGEIAMYPFVYFKMLFHKLTMVWVYSKSFRVSRADKFANFILYGLHGPFTLAGNSAVDTYYFVRHLLQFELQKIKHKTRQQSLEKEDLEVVQRYFEEKQEKLLNFKTISAQIRKDLRIEELLKDALFPDFDALLVQPTALARKDSVEEPKKHAIHETAEKEVEMDIQDARRKKALGKIKQFSLFKEIMDRNSAMFGVSSETLSSFDYSPEVHASLYQNRFKTIDCKLLHNTFQDWKRQKMMLKVKNDRYVFIERTTLNPKTMRKINRARA